MSSPQHNKIASQRWLVTTLTTQEVVSQRLHDAIVDLDRRNMADVFAAAGIPFPEEKRRKGFEVEGVFFIAFDANGRILGYLQFCRDWECSADMYVSSIQVGPEHRNGALFRQLMAHGVRWLRQHPFRQLKTHVQKSNRSAVDLYHRLGFTFLDNPKSDKSFILTADPSILESPFAKRLAR